MPFFDADSNKRSNETCYAIKYNAVDNPPNFDNLLESSISQPLAALVPSIKSIQDMNPFVVCAADKVAVNASVTNELTKMAVLAASYKPQSVDQPPPP